tara:strand:- start:4175 stop:5851 length:1677 start_codon:yes stop_codon:yes gene_type:complete
MAEGTGVQGTTTRANDISNAFRSALRLLGTLHPSHEKTIQNVLKRVDSGDMMPGELNREFRRINMGIMQDKDKEALNLRVATESVQKELQRLKQHNSLSSTQLERIKSLDIDESTDPASALGDLVKTLGTFVNDVINYREQQKVVDSGQHPNIKASGKSNIIAGDVAWSSKRIVKSIHPILKRLDHDFPEDTKIKSLLKDVESAIAAKTLDFYHSIDLMEAAARHIALLQTKRSDVESTFLVSFNQHLQKMHHALEESFHQNSHLLISSDKDREAFESLLRNFKVASDKEEDPVKLKKLISSNVSNMQEGFTKIINKQSAHTRNQQRAISNLKAEVRNQEKEVTRLKKQQTELNDVIGNIEEMSLTDDLTGIPNRRAYDKTIKALDAAMEKNNQQPESSIIVLDIDRFKQINDTYGHQIGDRVLKRISQLTSKALETLKSFDCELFRYGGEEFVIVCRGTPLKNAAQIAERLRSVIENHRYTVKEKPLQITSSFGVAAYNKLDRSGEAVFGVADSVLYRAKQLGRNRVICSVKNRPIDWTTEVKKRKQAADAAKNKQP